jgi:hypothetical protein
LTKLADKRLLLRRDGTDKRYITLGHCLSDVIWAWEAKESPSCPGVYVPLVTESTTQVPLVVVDLKHWFAQPIAIKCPMHVAIRKTSPDAGPNDPVDLPESTSFGPLSIVVEATDIERPLLETACRAGFWELPVSYLRELIAELGFEPAPTKDLVETIAYMALLIIPGLTEAELLDILRKRTLYFESDADDLGKVLELEFVMDIFQGQERKQLEDEIKEAKSTKRKQQEYHAALVVYKAFAAWPFHYVTMPASMQIGQGFVCMCKCRLFVSKANRHAYFRRVFMC